jgi:hypothetical protein
VLFPRAILTALGGWDETLLALQDTDLLLRAAAITTFARLRAEPVRVDTARPTGSPTRSATRCSASCGS